MGVGDKGIRFVTNTVKESLINSRTVIPTNAGQKRAAR